MNKKLTALFLIYAFQFVMSCDERCYCLPAKTFEKTFKGFELKAWDTSGFQSEEVTNTVNKNSFGLTVSVQFNFNQISYRQSKFDFSSFGFAKKDFSHTNDVNPVDRPTTIFVEWIPKDYLFAGESTFFHTTLGMKIGYTIFVK